MKLKSLFNFFSNTFLFGIILLCLVGISSTNVTAQKLSISKDFCDSIGDNNTCNGNRTFRPGGVTQTINFTVVSDPAGASGTGNVGVVIDKQTFSAGETKDVSIAANTIFIVCEDTPQGFVSLPRPEGSTGGTAQTTPPGMPNCIRFFSGDSSGNNSLKFLNLAQAPTAASAMLSGRIKDVNGKSLSRVTVMLTELSTGETFISRTNSFGRYIFEDLATAQDYLVSVHSRRYVFTPDSKVINLNQDLTDTDFTAQPRGDLIQSNP